jgi:Holliday junction resolvase RusA-like endonuclease
MDKSTATIKFSKDEINQLIRAIALRNNVSKSFPKDSEKEAYKKLKSDLENIVRNIIEGEQQVNNS